MRLDASALGVMSLFSDVPVPNLARLVIIETMKRGMDGSETWNNLMSIPWRRQNLGLRNALLRKLKIWELAGEYAQTYSVLDHILYDKFLILKCSMWRPLSNGRRV